MSSVREVAHGLVRAALLRDAARALLDGEEHHDHQAGGDELEAEGDAPGEGRFRGVDGDAEVDADGDYDLEETGDAAADVSGGAFGD